MGIALLLEAAPADRLAGADTQTSNSGIASEVFTGDAVLEELRGWGLLRSISAAVSFSTIGSSIFMLLSITALDSGEKSPHLPERDAMVGLLVFLVLLSKERTVSPVGPGLGM